jgi:hypothetical protein
MPQKSSREDAMHAMPITNKLELSRPRFFENKARPTLLKSQVKVKKAM